MPYQLHWAPLVAGALLLAREDVVTVALEGAELDELLTTAEPEQMLPVKVGVSAEPPRLST